MSKRAQKFNLKILIALTLGLSLMACGSKIRPPQGGFGSTPGVPPYGSSGTSSEVLFCSTFQTSDSSLQGRVQVYEGTNGIVNELTRVRIDSLPSTFSTDTGAFIEFYRWYASPDGSQTQIDSTPLEFSLEESSSKTQITGLFGKQSRFDKAALDRVISQNPQLSLNISNINFLVRGTETRYQVLKFVIRDSTEIHSEVDFLIPAFFADPNQYASQRPLVLQALHPFMNLRNQGLNVQDYIQMGQSYCF